MNSFAPVEVLIVEDNPQDAELAVRALRKSNIAANFQIAEDGEEALDFIFSTGRFSGNGHANNLKVIFLDLKLPKVGGLEVLKTVKSNESTRTIPVVVVTSSREEPDIQAAYALGANSYVVKPVDFESFMKTIGMTGQYWLSSNIPPRPAL